MTWYSQRKRWDIFRIMQLLSFASGVEFTFTIHKQNEKIKKIKKSVDKEKDK